MPAAEGAEVHPVLHQVIADTTVTAGNGSSQPTFACRWSLSVCGWSIFRMIDAIIS